MDAVVAAGKFPGLTAGVVAADGAAIGLASGVSDRDAKTPLKPTDRLMMGSVGKTYVAAVAMQLVAEGKISLDDRIEKWLGGEPWFRRLPNGRDTLIRHLMTHTSGLVRYEFQEKFVADMTRQPDKVWTPQEQLSYIPDHKIAVAVQFNTSVGRDIGKSPARVLLDLAAIAAGVSAAK
jgi:D-alanyl-D-alanine carboxypeptidase